MSNKRKAGEDGVCKIASELRDHVEVILAAARKEAEEMKKATIEEMAKWEKEKKDIRKARTFEPVIELNVGGKRMSTTLKTLTSFPDSTLGKMFSGRHNLPKDKNCAYFIDRDPLPFAEILTFLRSPKEYRAPEELKAKILTEATFFGLKDAMFPAPPGSAHNPKPPTAFRSRQYSDRQAMESASEFQRKLNNKYLQSHKF
jgi:hypothetical protein